MKTIKANLAGFILLVLASASLFLTCDVGLGNSVSTKPPTVSIEYPPVDNIIKNTFTMSGKSNAETSLKQVSVLLTDTTNASKTFGPYFATVDAAKKTWSLFVNKRNASGSFEVPDGSYQAVVTATDDAGRINTAAITYRIDNTPPVLVLQTPSTVASDSTTTAFGKNMNITGMVADTNSVQTLTLTVYDRTSLQSLLTKTFGPIPPNIDVSLPDDLYANLYANADTAADADGTKKYYYTVSATDYAKEYTPETSTGDGNTTNGYYIYSKIYSTVFGGTPTYTMTDLQNIFNGSKEDTNNILSYLASNKISSAAPTAATASTAGTFSINPSNNPTFSVQTFDAMDLTTLKYPEIAKNSTISIQVSVGRDNVPLVEDSIGVKLYYMEDFSSPLNADGTLNPAVKSTILLHGVGTETPAGDATARAADLAKKHGSDSDMTVAASGNNYLLAMYLPDSLAIHTKYYLDVTGRDKNGKEVSIGKKRYGFHITGTGVRPTITVSSEPGAFIVDGNVHYTGTILFPNGYNSFTVTGSPAATGTLSILRDGTSTPAVVGDMGLFTWDYTAIISSYFWQNGASVVYTTSQTPSVNADVFSDSAVSLKVDTVTAYDSVNKKITVGGTQYTYSGGNSGGDTEFTFKAKDLDNGETTEKNHFYYDRNPPTITINSVSPGTLVSADYGVNPLVVKDINGTITIKGNFSDDYRVASGSYTVKNNSGVAKQTGTIGSDKLASWSFDIDTSALTDGADNTVEITTTDASNQTTTKTITLKVDQSTDIPVVTFTNYDPNTKLPNGLYSYVGETTLKGMVSDDDGVIQAITAKVNGTDVTIPPNGNNFAIPMGSEGVKTLLLTVTDIKGTTFTFDTSACPLKVTKGASVIQPPSDMTIVVDTATPVISIDQTQNAYHKDSFTLSGTAQDSGSGIKDDRIFVDSNLNGDMTDDAIVTVNTGTHAWLATIDASSLGDGSYSVPIVAYDKAGQATNATFTFKKDSHAPNMAMNATVNTLLSGWVPTLNVIVKGTADDTGGTINSGIKSVEYSTDNVNWTAFTLTDEVDPSIKDWTGIVAFTQSDSNKLYVRATDNAGNVTQMIPKTVKVDTTKPTLTEDTVAAASSPKSYNGNIVFHGTASDALSGLKELTLSYVKDGDTAHPVSATIDTAVYAGSGYTFAVDANDPAHPQDGSYEFTLSAMDNAGNENTISYSVTVETKKPTVTMNMTPSDSTSGKYNGSVPVKASITDDNTIKSLYWAVTASASAPAYDAAKVKANGTAAEVGSGWTSLSASSSLNNLNETWSSSAVGTAGAETRYVWVMACDRFGNISIGDNTATPAANLTMSVDQSTDKPVLSYVNLTSGGDSLSNNLGTTLVLKGTVSDDDGVDKDKILIGIMRDDNNDGIADHTLAGVASTTFTYSEVTGAPSANGTQVSFSEDLGTGSLNLTEGYYVLQVRVGDINSGAAYDSASFNWTQGLAEKFVIDKAPPAVTIDQAQNQYMSSTFTLTGTAQDSGTGIKDDKISVNGDASVVVNTATHVWNKLITEASDGEYTIPIVAYDKANQVTNASFKFKIDSAKPILYMDSAVETKLAGWQKSTTVSVSGTVSDTNGSVHSGVKSVEYSTDSTNGNDGTWTAFTLTDSATKWNGVVTFAESAANKLYVRATDNAGNVTKLDTDTSTPLVFDPYIVKVDATKPTLTEDTISAKALPKSYNGNIVFKGTLSDSGSGLTHMSSPNEANEKLTLSYKVDGVDKTPIEINAANFTSGYTFAVDPDTHAQDGSYEFTLSAMDNAGNESTISYSVTVETKKPTVTMNMTPSDSTSGKYNGSVPVKASITDDNTIKSLYWAVTASASAPAYNEAKVKSNGTAAEVGSAWTSLSVSSSLNNLNETWSSIAAGTSGAEYRYVWVMACDRFGNISIGDNATTPAANLTMSVDQSTDKPVLSYVNLTSGGDSLSNNLGTTLVLKGTVSDDDGVDKDKILIGIMRDDNNDGIADHTLAGVASTTFTYSEVTGAPSANGTQVSFSEDLGTGSLNLTEGYYVLQVRVGDINSGAAYDSASFNWTQGLAEKFVIDKAPPAVTIDQAQNQYMSSTFTLTGTAQDSGTGIKDDKISVNGDASVVVNTATHVWNKLITEASDGEYTIPIVAYDKANQVTNASFKLKIDSAKPILYMDSAVETKLAGWQKSTTVSVSGTVSDTNGSVHSGVKSVEYSTDSTNGNDGTWTAFTLTDSATKWNGVVTFAESAANKLYVRATDNAGNETDLDTNALTPLVFDPYIVKVDATPPQIASAAPANGLITNSAVTLKGSVTETNLSSVTLTINGASYPATDPATDIQLDFAGAGYTIPLAALATGENTLLVTAKDFAGNTDSKTIAVIKDTSAPTFSFSSINANGTTIVTDSNPAITGSVADDNGVYSVESYIEKWNGSSWIMAQDWTSLGTPSSAKNYNWTKDLIVAPFSSAEGRYRITLRASDISSTTAPSTRNSTNGTIGGSDSVVFKVDRNSPALAVTSPVANSFQGSTFTVKGTTSDENYVTSVRVKVDSNDFTSGTIVPATTTGGISVTANYSAGTFNSPNHGLMKDQLVFLYSVDMPTGLTAWTPYYVCSAGLTADSFKLAAAKGDSAISFTANGSNLKLALYDGVEWSASLTPTGLTSGAHTFYVESRDGTGKTTLQSQVFYFDSTAPTVGFINPTDSSTVYGSITLRGVASDDIALASVKLHIGKLLTEQTIPDASKYNWSYTLDTGSLCNTTNATETSAGSGVWKLDVDAVATDTAGNSKTATLSFYIDNDQDKPKINIITPVTGDIIGGTFTVKGYATDNERVMGTEMQVEIEGANYVNNKFDFWNWKADEKNATNSVAATAIILGQPYKIVSAGTTNFMTSFGAASNAVGTVFVATKAGAATDGTGTVNDVYYEGNATIPTVRATDGATDGMFEDRTKWYRITGTSSWEYDLNRIGEFYKTYIASCDASASNSPTGRLIVKVRAFDTKSTGTPYARGVTGNPQTITVTMNEDIPSITGVTPSNNSKVRGQFTLHAAIYAPGTMGKLEVSKDGGSSYTDVSTDASVTKTDARNWILYYPINTAGTNAALSIRIRATDASVNKFASISYLSIEADNTYPDNGGTAIPKAALGTQYVVQGEARDTGTIGGVGRVEVYVTDTATTTIYKLKTSAGSTTSHTAVTLADGSTMSDPLAPSTGSVFYPNADDDYRIVIDRDEASVSADADGYYETLQLSGGVYSWSTKFDSTLLTDGKYLLHYVIYDQAGNGTHYSKQILVQNHRPTINSVDLATDLDGDGATTTSGESLNFTSFGDTGFNVHGNRLKFTVNASSGNGTLHYSVNRLQSVVSASSMVAGNLYRIKTVGLTPFNTVGADSNTVGVMFVATGPCSTGTGDAYLVSSSTSVVASGSFVSGQTYYTKAIGSADLTAIGAPANQVGIYFTATGAGSVDSSTTAFLIPNYMSSNGQTLTDFTGMPEDTVNGTYFALRVWDTTAGTTPGVDSLETSVVMHVTLDNVDGTAPQIAVADIGQRFSSTGATWASRTIGNVASYDDNVQWTDANSNGTRDIDETQGHVEYATNSKFDGTDADVSGIIKIRGKVQDNQRIKKITVSFNKDFDLDGTGAASAVTAGTEIDLATFGSGSLSSVRTTTVDYASNTLGFSVDDKNSPEQSNTNGHIVNFTLTWNSAFIAGVANKGVILTFRAYDAVSTSVTASTATIQVDVVPYIAKVTTAVTGLLNNDLTRSSTGKYSVKTGETVKITGYNLNPTATGTGTGTSDVRLTGSANRDSVTKTGRGIAYTASTLGYTTLNATVSSLTTDSSIGSGYLNVFTNSVPSINSLSGRTNAETNFVATSGTDERWLTVWDLTTLKSLGASKSQYAVYPSMAMNGDKPAFSYVYNKEGYGGAYYWNGTSENYIYELWDLFTFTSLALNSDNGYCSLLDVNLAQSGTDPRPSDKGGIMTAVFYTPPKNSGMFSGEFRDYQIWLDNLAKAGTNAVLDRYTYPDIYVTGNNATTVVYYSTYDSIDNKVVVRSFKVGTSSSGVGSTNKITDNTVDGTSGTTSVYTNIPQYNENGTFPTYLDNNSNNNARIMTTQNDNSGKSPTGAYTFPSSGSGAGQWSAIAATSGNVALLVWYDTNTNELKYTYNTSASVSGGGTWQTAMVLDTLCAGEFVDMKVDSANHIHIAYSDGSRLKYVYLNAYNSASFSGPYVVDSYLGVGDKCSLSVDSSNVPYISYKGLAKTAKIAWLVGTLGDGADSNSKFTGKWEVQVLPTSITENDSNRYLVGNRSSDKNPVVGYTNNGVEYIRRLSDL